jgi:hypothetical protein
MRTEIAVGGSIQVTVVHVVHEDLHLRYS